MLQLSGSDSRVECGGSNQIRVDVLIVLRVLVATFWPVYLVDEGSIRMIGASRTAHWTERRFIVGLESSSFLQAVA